MNENKRVWYTVKNEYNEYISMEYIDGDSLPNKEWICKTEDECDDLCIKLNLEKGVK